MKNIYTFLFLAPFFGTSQTVTSVAAGNFYSPATWDCTCIPNATDTIYVNHALTMDFGVVCSGLLQVGGAGSLNDGGAGNGIYIDGGELTNIGTINCSGILLETGYMNNLAQMYLDSLWTRDTVSNMGIIDITANFLHDLDGHFTNWGTIDVGNDFLNEAIFMNNSNMAVHHDFANCNYSGGPEATFEINGELCVYNDFLNCVDDTMLGNGTVYITGTSSNAGEMQGNFIVNTPSGSFTTNTGNIAAGISYGTAICDASLAEDEMTWGIFPNPADHMVTSTETSIHFEIFDVSGRLVLSGFSEDGMISVELLNQGIYAVRMSNKNNDISTALLRKL